MKETVKAIFLLAVIYLLLFFLVNTNRKSQTKQPEPKDIIISDTITNVVYDTTFLERYKTVKLPIHDTLNQIIIRDSLRIDSVFVEIPISKFQLDTTFTTDTTVFNLSIRNSGYAVTLDTIFYNFKYTPRPQKKTNFFKEHFKFGAGVSTGYGCFSKQPDIFVGVGLYYTF